jgi:hypothetical protein
MRRELRIALRILVLAAVVITAMGVVVQPAHAVFGIDDVIEWCEDIYEVVTDLPAYLANYAVHPLKLFMKSSELTKHLQNLVIKPVLQGIATAADIYMETEIPQGVYLNPLTAVMFQAVGGEDFPILKYLDECPDISTPEGREDLQAMIDLVELGLTQIRLACEANGIVIDGLWEDIDIDQGDTLRNYWEARRRLDWILSQVHDNLPDDVFSVAGKLTVAGFYATANRLTTCLEYYDALETWDELFADLDYLKDGLTEQGEDITIQLAEHDANIDADLAAHDANIDADLAAHDARVVAALQHAQETLDNDVELRRVHLQVIEVKERQQYLVSATEAGLPVTVEFTAVAASDKTLQFVDVIDRCTVTEVAPGIYRLAVNLPQEVRDAEYFLFRVTDLETVQHFGFALFGKGGVDSGQ